MTLILIAILAVLLIAAVVGSVATYKGRMALFEATDGAWRRSTSRRYIERNIGRAKEIDPGAFPAGGFVVYWPEISDARQMAALEQANHENETAVRV